METHFAVMFEDIRHERALTFLWSLTDLDIIKQAKVTDHEIKGIKNLASEKLHKQRILKEEVAIASLEAELE